MNEIYPMLLTPGDAIQYWCKTDEYEYEEADDFATLELFWGADLERSKLDSLKQYLGMSAWTAEVDGENLVVTFRR